MNVYSLCACYSNPESQDDLEKVYHGKNEIVVQEDAGNSETSNLDIVKYDERLIGNCYLFIAELSDGTIIKTSKCLGKKLTAPDYIPRFPSNSSP